MVRPGYHSGVPRRPPAPPGIGARARGLWRAVHAGYELDPVEAALLAQMCRVLDTIERLDALLDHEQLTVEGSTGQTRAHPLLAELAPSGGCSTSSPTASTCPKTTPTGHTATRLASCGRPNVARRRPRPALTVPDWVQNFDPAAFGDDDTSHDPEIITALTKTWAAMDNPGGWWRFELTELERAEARWRAACERWRAATTSTRRIPRMADEPAAGPPEAPKNAHNPPQKN